MSDVNVVYGRVSDSVCQCNHIVLYVGRYWQCQWAGCRCQSVSLWMSARPCQPAPEKRQTGINLLTAKEQDNYTIQPTQCRSIVGIMPPQRRTRWPSINQIGINLLTAKEQPGSVFSYKLRYIAGFGLVEMAISTNSNFYENTGPGQSKDRLNNTHSKHHTWLW